MHALRALTQQADVADPSWETDWLRSLYAIAFVLRRLHSCSIELAAEVCAGVKYQCNSFESESDFLECFSRMSLCMLVHVRIVHEFILKIKKGCEFNLPWFFVLSSYPV